MSFIGELKRRNVFRMAAAYAVVGWLIVEVSSVVLPTFEAPEWVPKVITFLILLGFPMALAFAWAFEMTPDGLKKERDVARQESITRATGRKLDFFIIGVLAIAVVFLIVDNYWLTESRDAQTSAQAAAGAPEEPVSIAVLPFVNMSADEENEYFSDGITEELLNLLAQLPELRVSSRTSSFSFKGTSADIPTVAGKLGVRNVLEGSVRRSGDRVRITAQLIDAQSDSHLWSQTYDRRLEDIFKVQDDIARNIVDALKVTLTPEEARSLEVQRASSVDAYDHYLRARYYANKSTLAGLRRAQELYGEALGTDPDYALAYAGLAMTHADIYIRHDSDPEQLKLAERYSRKAVELAPDLDQAHVARGFAHVVNRQYTEGDRELKEAMRLNPRSIDAHYRYGASRYLQGDLEGTAASWERVIELDPDHKFAWYLLPQVYNGLDRPADELHAYRRSAEVFEQALDHDPDDVQDLIGLAAARLALGQSEEAFDSLEHALTVAGDDAAVLYNVACVYSLGGQSEKALDMLEKSFEAGLSDPEWMEQDSDLDNLRDDPRFSALLKKMRASNAKKLEQAGRDEGSG